MQTLSSWHSPYTALVDCSNLSIKEDEEITAELEKMVKFFKGFFLKKIIGYGHNPGQGHACLPFEILGEEAEARARVGLDRTVNRDSTDFRSAIIIQNDFRAHVIEVELSQDFRIEDRKQVMTLKDKLTNNLMQWHSGWNLLFDCHHLDIDEATHPDWDRMFTFFRGFFLKKVIGYRPKGPKTAYPFPVYRSRHRAVAELEGEGVQDGAEANCASRKDP